eukprot:2474698-Rhodomonas_salina.2
MPAREGGAPAVRERAVQRLSARHARPPPGTRVGGAMCRMTQTGGVKRGGGCWRVGKEGRDVGEVDKRRCGAAERAGGVKEQKE